MKQAILKYLNFGILACVGVSLFMRGRLFNMAYEYDELFTAITTDPMLPFSWLYSNYLLVDVHPPLYNAILWVWNHFVPYGPELWLRLPSFFMGIGALMCAWFFFPKFFGKLTRLVFVGLLSCNIYLIFYSQHARSYMLMLLFSVPVTFLFLDIFRRIAKHRRVAPLKWVTFAVLSILLCWSHYFGALLVGLCSIFLFANAWYNKTYIRTVLIIIAAITMSFLPWLVPNFIEQISFKRFAGNWWANDSPWSSIPEMFLLSFFTKWYTGIIMFALISVSFVWLRTQYRYRRGIPYFREMLLLLSIFVCALVIVALLSLKTYMFFGRYFIAFFPVVYLLIAVLLAPLMRRSLCSKSIFIGLLVVNLVIFGFGHKELKYTPKISSRMVSQIYKNKFRGKEIFVIAVEGFPPVTMPAMYGFYVNRVFGLNVPVTELFWLDDESRNRALTRKENAFIWMPNCTKAKLQKVSSKWNRSLGVYGRVSDVCILKISD